MHFKDVRAPLGLERTIFTWLGTGRYKLYQSRSPISMWRFVGPIGGVCLFDPVIPWYITRTLSPWEERGEERRGGGVL